MAEVLDIRAVFPRVSAITSHVLAHDALALVFVDAANSLRLEARSTDDVPQIHAPRLPRGRSRIFGRHRVARIALPVWPLSAGSDLVAQLANAGYRSLAVVGAWPAGRRSG